jgi:hypothetical protein
MPDAHQQVAAEVVLAQPRDGRQQHREPVQPVVRTVLLRHRLLAVLQEVARLIAQCPSLSALADGVRHLQFANEGHVCMLGQSACHANMSSGSCG